jgi:hypothetical protein
MTTSQTSFAEIVVGVERKPNPAPIPSQSASIDSPGPKINIK